MAPDPPYRNRLKTVADLTVPVVLGTEFNDAMDWG